LSKGLKLICETQEMIDRKKAMLREIWKCSRCGTRENDGTWYPDPLDPDKMVCAECNDRLGGLSEEEIKRRVTKRARERAEMDEALSDLVEGMKEN
jgi:uncharacterized protein with PIN domain